MLATRPTLLYLAGKAVKGQGDQELPFQPLHQFVTTCVDAAQRSLAILRALRHQQLLGKFFLCPHYPPRAEMRKRTLDSSTWMPYSLSPLFLF